MVYRLGVYRDGQGYSLIINPAGTAAYSSYKIKDKNYK